MPKTIANKQRVKGGYEAPKPPRNPKQGGDNTGQKTVSLKEKPRLRKQPPSKIKVPLYPDRLASLSLRRSCSTI
jgi:hypothetical protein